MRVQRGLHEVPHLVETYHAFKNNPSGLSAQDCIRLFDFPPPSVQDENIASVRFTKHELLKRAVYYITKHWTDITCNEAEAYDDALGALEEVSVEYCHELLAELEGFQQPLYEENEAEAVKDTINEILRRMREESQARGQSDLDVAFRIGKPWLRQLWDEDQGQKSWGFAMFENPQFAIDDRRDSYAAERHRALHRSLQALGTAFVIGDLWQVESPNWPTEATLTGEESFPEILDSLRRKFRELRAQPSKEQTSYPRGGTDPIYGRVSPNNEIWGNNLSSGALRNAFLYLDHESATSVLHSHGLVDRM